MPKIDLLFFLFFFCFILLILNCLNMIYNKNAKSIISNVIAVASEKKTTTLKHDSHTNKTAVQCYRYGGKNGKQCEGYERLPTVSYESIRWMSANNNTLKSSGDAEELDEYECLVSFYEFTANYSNITAFYDYDNILGGCKVDNYIRKFSSIQILGYQYFAANKSGKGGYFCAYKCNNYDEKVLTPGQIQFFFTHTLKQESQDSTTQVYTYYFAFVRWFKPQNANGRLSSHTHNDGSRWQNVFEDLSEDCILPVHKIHSGITNRLNYMKNINTVVFLPRKFN